MLYLEEKMADVQELIRGDVPAFDIGMEYKSFEWLYNKLSFYFSKENLDLYPDIFVHNLIVMFDWYIFDDNRYVPDGEIDLHTKMGYFYIFDMSNDDDTNDDVYDNLDYSRRETWKFVLDKLNMLNFMINETRYD